MLWLLKRWSTSLYGPYRHGSLIGRPCSIHCFFFFSSRRRHTRFDCDWSSDVCSSDLARSDNPEERFARREMRKRMADSIRQLAPELRRVCLLRDVMEYSTQEVAQRLGVSSLTVRLRLFRARRRLREKLALPRGPQFPSCQRPVNA